MEIRCLNDELKQRFRSGININNVPQCINELVLNSIDAKSTAIAIRVNLISFRLEVVDNGEGIAKSNLNLVGKPYMTSKCHSLEDYKKNLKSYGFRGETLSTLTNTSRKLTITSRYLDNEATFSKTFEFNKPPSLDSTVLRPSQGTTVTIEDFMFNLPIRQSRVNSELDLVEIKRNLECLSVVHPEIVFSLRNDLNKKMVYKSNRFETAAEALLDLIPQLDGQGLVQIKVSKDRTTICGLVYKHEFANNKFQWLYVNKRPVACNKLQKFVETVLANRLNHKSKNFVYALNIKCPYAQVEFTCHPGKTLVEFRHWDLVYKCLEKALTKFLVKEDVEDDKVESVRSLKNVGKISLSALAGVCKVTAKRRKEFEEHGEDLIEGIAEEVQGVYDFGLKKDSEKREETMKRRNENAKNDVADDDFEDVEENRVLKKALGKSQQNPRKSRGKSADLLKKSGKLVEDFNGNLEKKESLKQKNRKKYDLKSYNLEVKMKKEKNKLKEELKKKLVETSQVEEVDVPTCSEVKTKKGRLEETVCLPSCSGAKTKNEKRMEIGDVNEESEVFGFSSRSGMEIGRICNEKLVETEVGKESEIIGFPGCSRRKKQKEGRFVQIEDEEGVIDEHVQVSKEQKRFEEKLFGIEDDCEEFNFLKDSVIELENGEKHQLPRKHSSILKKLSSVEANDEKLGKALILEKFLSCQKDFESEDFPRKKSPKTVRKTRKYKRSRTELVSNISYKIKKKRRVSRSSKSKNLQVLDEEVTNITSSVTVRNNFCTRMVSKCVQTSNVDGCLRSEIGEDEFDFVAERKMCKSVQTSMVQTVSKGKFFERKIGLLTETLDKSKYFEEGFTLDSSQCCNGNCGVTQGNCFGKFDFSILANQSASFGESSDVIQNARISVVLDQSDFGFENLLGIDQNVTYQSHKLETNFEKFCKEFCDENFEEWNGKFDKGETLSKKEQLKRKLSAKTKSVKNRKNDSRKIKILSNLLIKPKNFVGNPLKKSVSNFPKFPNKPNFLQRNLYKPNQANFCLDPNFSETNLYTIRNKGRFANSNFAQANIYDFPKKVNLPVGSLKFGKDINPGKNLSEDSNISAILEKKFSRKASRDCLAENKVSGENLAEDVFCKKSEVFSEEKESFANCLEENRRKAWFDSFAGDGDSKLCLGNQSVLPCGNLYEFSRNYENFCCDANKFLENVDCRNFPGKCFVKGNLKENDFGKMECFRKNELPGIYLGNFGCDAKENANKFVENIDCRNFPGKCFVKRNPEENDFGKNEMPGKYLENYCCDAKETANKFVENVDCRNFPEKCFVKRNPEENDFAKNEMRGKYLENFRCNSKETANKFVENVDCRNFPGKCFVKGNPEENDFVKNEMPGKYLENFRCNAKENANKFVENVDCRNFPGKCFVKGNPEENDFGKNEMPGKYLENFRCNAKENANKFVENVDCRNFTEKCCLRGNPEENDFGKNEMPGKYLENFRCNAKENANKFLENVDCHNFPGKCFVKGNPEENDFGKNEMPGKYLENYCCDAKETANKFVENVDCRNFTEKFCLRGNPDENDFVKMEIFRKNYLENCAHFRENERNDDFNSENCCYRRRVKGNLLNRNRINEDFKLPLDFQPVIRKIPNFPKENFRVKENNFVVENENLETISKLRNSFNSEENFGQTLCFGNEDIENCRRNLEHFPEKTQSDGIYASFCTEIHNNFPTSSVVLEENRRNCDQNVFEQNEFSVENLNAKSVNLSRFPEKVYGNFCSEIHNNFPTSRVVFEENRRNCDQNVHKQNEFSAENLNANSTNLRHFPEKTHSDVIYESFPLEICTNFPSPSVVLEENRRNFDQKVHKQNEFSAENLKANSTNLRHFLEKTHSIGNSEKFFSEIRTNFPTSSIDLEENRRNFDQNVHKQNEFSAENLKANSTNLRHFHEKTHSVGIYGNFPSENRTNFPTSSGVLEENRRNFDQKVHKQNEFSAENLQANSTNLRNFPEKTHSIGIYENFPLENRTNFPTASVVLEENRRTFDQNVHKQNDFSAENSKANSSNLRHFPEKTHSIGIYDNFPSEIRTNFPTSGVVLEENRRTFDQNVHKQNEASEENLKANSTNLRNFSEKTHSIGIYKNFPSENRTNFPNASVVLEENRRNFDQNVHKQNEFSEENLKANSTNLRHFHEKTHSVGIYGNFASENRTNFPTASVVLEENRRNFDQNVPKQNEFSAENLKANSTNLRHFHEKTHSVGIYGNFPSENRTNFPTSSVVLEENRRTFDENVHKQNEFSAENLKANSTNLRHFPEKTHSVGIYRNFSSENRNNYPTSSGGLEENRRNCDQNVFEQNEFSVENLNANSTNLRHFHEKTHSVGIYGNFPSENCTNFPTSSVVLEENQRNFDQNVHKQNEFSAENLKANCTNLGHFPEKTHSVGIYKNCSSENRNNYPTSSGGLEENRRNCDQNVFEQNEFSVENLNANSTNLRNFPEKTHSVGIYKNCSSENRNNYPTSSVGKEENRRNCDQNVFEQNEFSVENLNANSTNFHHFAEKTHSVEISENFSSEIRTNFPTSSVIFGENRSNFEQNAKKQNEFSAENLNASSTNLRQLEDNSQLNSTYTMNAAPAEENQILEESLEQNLDKNFDKFSIQSVANFAQFEDNSPLNLTFPSQFKQTEPIDFQTEIPNEDCQMEVEEIVQMQAFPEPNREITSEWNKEIGVNGQIFFVNQRTGMSSIVNPEEDANYEFAKRLDFMPKGLSPILHNNRELFDTALSQRTKDTLYEKLMQSHEDELGTVKWRKIIENKDPKVFFDAIYSERNKRLSNVPNLTKFSAGFKPLSSMAFSKDVLKDIKVLGQLDNKFVVALAKSNIILLFDQHAVHERIRLEGLYKEYNIDGVCYNSLKLDKPLNISLSESDVSLVKLYEFALANFGLKFARIDGKTVQISEIPACFSKKTQKDIELLKDLVKALIEEQIDSIRNTRGTVKRIPRIVRHVVNSEACRGAIMFGDALNLEECRKLMGQLSLCSLPFQCAHGRPTLAPIIELQKTVNVLKKPNLKKLIGTVNGR